MLDRRAQPALVGLAASAALEVQRERARLLRLEGVEQVGGEVLLVAAVAVAAITPAPRAGYGSSPGRAACGP